MRSTLNGRFDSSNASRILPRISFATVGLITRSKSENFFGSSFYSGTKCKYFDVILIQYVGNYFFVLIFDLYLSHHSFLSVSTSSVISLSKDERPEKILLAISLL